jgi:hypothetical protein
MVVPTASPIPQIRGKSYKFHRLASAAILGQLTDGFKIDCRTTGEPVVENN